MIGELNQRPRRENVEIGRRPGRLRAAGGGADQAEAARVGRDRGRQNAGDRGHRAVEREFADHGVAVQRVGGDRPDRRHHAERDRQIVMAALLGHVGGGEIDGDALGRQSEARGDQCGAHALAQFGNRLVTEAHDHECDRATGDLNLYVDRARLNALESQRGNARHHVRPLRWPCRSRRNICRTSTLWQGASRENSCGRRFMFSARCE